MTREERFKMDMIDEFKQMCEIVEKDGRIIENKRRMLKALSQEPICPSHGIDCEDCPAYDPCGDVISREELLKAIDTWDKFGFTTTGCFVREPKGDYVPYIHYDDVIKSINDMPPVTPQPKTGHWTHDGSHWKNRFICSECGYKLFDKPTNYCPNCGRCMVEPQESEE